MTQRSNQCQTYAERQDAQSNAATCRLPPPRLPTLRLAVGSCRARRSLAVMLALGGIVGLYSLPGCTGRAKSPEHQSETPAEAPGPSEQGDPLSEEPGEQARSDRVPADSPGGEPPTEAPAPEAGPDYLERLEAMRQLRETARAQAFAKLAPDTPVLWLKEVAGYVPVEMADLYHRYPYRLLLTADGTLTYRNDRFDRWRVQLTPAERDALFEHARATGILDIDRRLLPPDSVAMVLDAGGEELGYFDGKRRTEIEFTASTNYWLMARPDDRDLQRWHAYATLLKGFTHARAEALDPDDGR